MYKTCIATAALASLLLMLAACDSGPSKVAVSSGSLGETSCLPSLAARPDDGSGASYVTGCLGEAKPVTIDVRPGTAITFTWGTAPGQKSAYPKSLRLSSNVVATLHDGVLTANGVGTVRVTVADRDVRCPKASTGKREARCLLATVRVLAKKPN